MKPVTLLTLASCLVAGLAVGLLGGLKLSLARRGASLRGLRLLNLVAILLLVASGLLADTFGVRPTLMGGSALLCLGLLGVCFAGSTKSGPWMVATAAAGACALLISTLIMLPYGLVGSHETAASFNLGLVFIAMGGLLAPVLLSVLSAATTFRAALIFFALASLSPACLVPFVAAGDCPEPARPALAGFVALAANPSIWLAGMVFFLYAPLEAFLSPWVTVFLRNHNEPTVVASRWMMWFWVSLTASRVLFGLAQHVTKLGDMFPVTFLVVPALLAAIVLGNLSGTARHEQALSGLMALGFFLGPVLPMLLAIVLQLHATTFAPATALSLVFACGAAGSVALAPLVGWSTQERQIHLSLRVPLLMSLGLAATSLFFGLVIHGQ